jgi:alpha-tubulin suppressor-like RCC1 family protein
LTPVSVTGISTAATVAVGYQHACAVLSDGIVQCWGGNNDGQLGNGTFTDSSTPVSATGISTATTVAAGYNNTCAVITSGGIKCWGTNLHGEVGDGTFIYRYVPVDVVEIEKYLETFP